MQEALRLLKEAGRGDILLAAATAEEGWFSRARPPQWRASEGVAAAVFACSPPRIKMPRSEAAAGERPGECRERAVGQRKQEIQRDRSPGGTNQTYKSPRGTKEIRGPGGAGKQGMKGERDRGAGDKPQKGGGRGRGLGK